MRICIDSCVFIRGLQQGDPIIQRLIALIGPAVQLVIPRLVAQEVARNLRSPRQVRRFYRLFHELEDAAIVDGPIPRALVEKYTHLGLPAKADASIGAFAEWMRVSYVVSDNRHFLQSLHTDAFVVLDAEEFLSRLDMNAL